MTKYARLQEALAAHGEGLMKCFGNSMLPILSNPSLCRYRVQDSYGVGDIVFCKVRARFIDAHKITQKAADGSYLISNNKGHDNGWTRAVFGRVVEATDIHGNVKRFD